MTILEELRIFSFTIIPGEGERIADVIKEKGAQWGTREYEIDRPCQRDVRIITLSPNGLSQWSAIRRAILLSEVQSSEGPINLFVSSVRDGYRSMVVAISKAIPDEVVQFRMSYFPASVGTACFIKSFVAGKSQRSVYVTRDDISDRWEFFEQGQPLKFEEPELYQARRKKDRLNLTIISSYLKKLGYVSLEREFWINAHASARLLAHGQFRIWHPPEDGNSDGDQ